MRGASAPLLGEEGIPVAGAAEGPAASVAGSGSGSGSGSVLRRLMTACLIPLTDHTGSARSIGPGLAGIVLAGAALGLLVPTDPNLPTPAYRTASSIIGYTYFLAWSVSFYPQILQNHRRRSTSGFSTDFGLLNVLGFACYATYTLCLYCSPTVRKMYIERNGPGSEITVQSNDVAFAVHALLLCLVQAGQVWWYGGFAEDPPSRPVVAGLSLVAASVAGFSALLAALPDADGNDGGDRFGNGNGPGGPNWLDLLYLLSCVKVLVSVVKYVPQVLLNRHRRSTAGWNIWNVLLDFLGGTLSVVQQVGDSYDLQDFHGITGNPAKFALGFVSVAFDVGFFVQHYCLYPEAERGVGGSGEEDDEEDGVAEEEGTRDREDGRLPQTEALLGGVV